MNVPVNEAKLEEDANALYELVIAHINKVLVECELHGISSVIYIKDPSIAERLEMIGKAMPIIRALENVLNDVIVKVKLRDAATCFTSLKTLLESVRAIDEESFNHAKRMLNFLVNSSLNGNHNEHR